MIKIFNPAQRRIVSWSGVELRPGGRINGNVKRWISVSAAGAQAAVAANVDARPRRRRSGCKRIRIIAGLRRMVRQGAHVYVMNGCYVSARPSSSTIRGTLWLYAAAAPQHVTGIGANRLGSDHEGETLEIVIQERLQARASLLPGATLAAKQC